MVVFNTVVSSRIQLNLRVSITTPFFIGWDLAGKYPKILSDEVVGEAATNLLNDAQKMLQQQRQSTQWWCHVSWEGSACSK